MALAVSATLIRCWRGVRPAFGGRMWSQRWEFEWGHIYGEEARRARAAGEEYDPASSRDLSKRIAEKSRELKELNRKANRELLTSTTRASYTRPTTVEVFGVGKHGKRKMEGIMASTGPGVEW